MFNIFKKKPAGTQTVFKIDGMHCTSCSMSIDGELEDAEGVISADTSYAKSETKVSYDPEKTSPETLKKIIESLGYRAAD